MSKNTKLVWSDDPKDKSLVEPRKNKMPVVPNVPLVVGGDWTAVFRIEKGGRGGKIVTVIDRLPKHETFLRDLCKELKSKVGSGGTYSIDAEGGTIEIQGDKRLAIKTIFDKKGYRYKGM